MKAKVVAVRDDKFRASLSIYLQERRVQISEFMKTFWRLASMPADASAHAIAIGLIALCEGISYAHSCDPRCIDDRTAEDVRSWFFKSISVVPQEQVVAPRQIRKRSARGSI